MKEPKDSRLIQDLLGQKLIDLVKETTRSELDVPASYEGGLFSHVSDADTRKALAQIMYETRWIYKLGLTLVVSDEEQTAHVRVQIFGYGSVCEGLLHDAFEHGRAKGSLLGQNWKYWDPPKNTKLMPPTAQRRDFFKLTRIALEEGMIGASLYNTLEALRLDRNTVHAKALAVHSFGRFYVPRGKTYFEAAIKTAQATKAWKAAHP